RPVLILRADAGEENHCTAPEAFHGDGLREDAIVHALWVNSFFSNAGAGGCCAATGVTTRHTTAVAIRAAKLRIGTSSGLANGVQSSHPRARPVAILTKLEEWRALVGDLAAARC